MKEIFRDIKDFEGLYQVSNLGNIFNLKTNQLMKLQFDAYGYHIIGLYKDGKHYTKKVHRLVAQTFIPNPNNLPCINHKSEIRTDNIVENLEWCDIAYNNSYGKRSYNNKIAQHNKPILQFDLQGNFIKEWFSSRDIENSLGFQRTNICSCCKGRVKTAYGYKWKFKEGA